MASDSLTRLVDCDRGDYAILSGYPDDKESKWHVNKVAFIGASGSRTAAVILQAADASEHWFTVTLEQAEREWTVDSVRAFKGDPPSGLSSDDAGEEIDPDDVELVDVTKE